MSNVQECIDLYLTDEEVSDAQFRAVIVDACARDLIDGPDDVPTIYRADLAAQLAERARALVLLNRIDDVRRDQLGQLDKDVQKLTGFCDSLAGQVRVLRERLDNLEGK